MEALCSFPVVVAVFVLLFDFSAAVIQKSRAQVAVREIAFRHLIDAASLPYSKSEDVYNGTWPGVKDEGWRRGFRNYSFEENKVLTRGFKDNETTGNHPTGNKNDVEMKAGDGDDDGGSGFLILANGVLAALGGQRDYTVWLGADYPFQTLLPLAKSKATFFVDSSPWTKHELPCGYLSILTKALGLGDISGSGGGASISLGSWLGCGEEAAPYDPRTRYDEEAARGQAQAERDEAARKARIKAEEEARKAAEAKK